MPSTKREKEIEQYLVDQAEARDGRALKITCPGRKGIPDRLVILPRCHMFLVEMKSRDKNGKLSGHQRRFRKWMQDRGHLVPVPYTKSQVDDVIRMIVEAKL